MKILYIIPANIKNGHIVYSTFLKTEIEGMKSVVDEVQIFYFLDRKSIDGFVKSLKLLNQHIATFKPDLIHVHYGATTGLLGWLSKKKCAWLITFGGSDLLGHPNKGVYWRLREYWATQLSHKAAKHADKIICVSENLLHKLSPVNQRKTIILPRGINLELFQISDKHECRKTLGWDNDKKYVLFSLPRLNADVKNKPLAEATLNILNSKSPGKFQLIILHDKPQEYLRQAMCAADALLVTSLHEGSPNIVKESMACNLPVVTVNCGDVMFRLNNVKPGKVVKDYDALKLSNALDEVIKSGVRSNGRNELISQGIASDQVLQRLKGLYEQTMEEYKTT
jgi:teichuronic acid biosynthesis glycosyltransferase TuaC